MRTVLTIDPTGETDPVYKTEKFNIKVERHPQNVYGMTFTKPLEFSAAQQPDWSIANAVVERGRLLRTALRQHAGIAAVLDALPKDPKDAVHPIYVKLDHGDAELITWETLCDVNDGFVTLDRRWPIGRITDPVSTQPRSLALFRTPVRLLAVISAIGIRGQKREWQHLRDAAVAARTAGLPVLLRVLVGESGLYDTIKGEITAGLPWAEVASVPGSGTQLMSAIRNWQPHIVHFFGHGTTAGGIQQLEFGTASDFKDPTIQRGSVAVDADQVESLGQKLDNPWLLTLNCCKGAEASREMTSLAYQAVSLSFLAAVAMLEAVDELDAYEFTRAFYNELFADLRDVATAMDKGEPRAPFEWARMMGETRIALNKAHGSDAPSRKEWVLPVLYVRGVDPMQFDRPLVNESDELSREFTTSAALVARWLTGVRDSMPKEKRVEVMKEVLADVPRKYWPSVDGVLGTVSIAVSQMEVPQMLDATALATWAKVNQGSGTRRSVDGG